MVYPWCVLYNNTVAIHMKIDPSSVGPLSLYGLCQMHSMVEVFLLDLIVAHLVTA